MQTSADKVGFDVACPHCAHRFKIVESESSNSGQEAPSQSYAPGDEPTVPPRQSPVDIPSAGYVSPYPAPTNYKAAAQPAVDASAYRPGSYACPYCQTTDPPIWKSEVSTIGWIVFAVLLVTTCFLCFIGLFIRDRYRVCSRCKVRLD